MQLRLRNNKKRCRRFNVIQDYQIKPYTLPQATTLHGFPSPPSFRLGEVPNNSTQDPQCNIDPFTAVLGRPTVFFFPFALASKACLEVFPEAFCLHGQTI